MYRGRNFKQIQQSDNQNYKQVESCKTPKMVKRGSFRIYNISIQRKVVMVVMKETIMNAGVEIVLPFNLMMVRNDDNKTRLPDS